MEIFEVAYPYSE